MYRYRYIYICIPTYTHTHFTINMNLSLKCQPPTATEPAQWNNTTTPPRPPLEALKCLLHLGWPSGEERKPMPVFPGCHMGFLAGNPQAAANFPIFT